VYDDGSQILRNQLIEKWRFVPYYFNIQVWAHINPHQAGNYYRPIFMLWMRINHALFGFNPVGWHLTTVMMHVLATFFVFKLARRLSSRDDLSAVCALIFGIHPVHIEAVAWVSGVTEALFACLLIPSFLWFLDWRQGRANARTYSLLLYALAILSKETAVLMMPLVFAYEWIYPRNQHTPVVRRAWNSIAAAIPFLAVTLVYLYFRFLALDGLMHVVDPLPVRTNLLTIPSVLWFYLKLLLWPVGLSAFYDTPYVYAPVVRQFWLPLIGVAAAGGGLFYWWWKTRDRLVAFASVLLVLPLLPLMNLSVFFQGEIAHDRYLYTPSIGFSLLAAIALTKIAELWSYNGLGRDWKPLVITAPIALLLLAITVWQSLYWADNLVLYRRGVTVAPQNNLALNNLANELEHRHMYPQAIAMYGEVLKRNPNFYLANYNLGYVLFENKQFADATHFLRRAVALDPTDAETFYHLGQSEMQLGQLDAAEADLHRAIITDARLLGPRYALGLLLKQEGRNREALDYFRAELEKNPGDANARREIESLSGK
jgi:Tfp pilus assembly protein PilF